MAFADGRMSGLVRSPSILPFGFPWPCGAFWPFRASESGCNCLLLGPSKDDELVSPESLSRFYRCRPYAVRLPRSLYVVSFGGEGGSGQGADGGGPWGY